MLCLFTVCFDLPYLPFASINSIVFITVKPDVLFHVTLLTSATMLVFWLAVCSEQFATSSNNLLATVANLLASIARQIPPEIVNFSWNTPKMISHGRKSDEKCYVEELARFAVVIKEFYIVDECVVVWYSKVKLCFTFVDYSIYCLCLLSLAVRYIISYTTIKSLRKIVEVTCHIKIKRNLMVALLLILRDCRVAINTLFKHFVRSDRPQISSACTKNQLSHVPSEIFNLNSNWPRNLLKQICNFREQVVRAGCKLLRANCQSKYQHCGRSLQSCAEKNIRFDCKTNLLWEFNGTCIYSM